jgi:hypothetical protein
MCSRCLVTLFTTALLLGFVLPAGASTAASVPDPVQAHQALFIENVGQFHPDVRYLIHLESGPMYITQDGLWQAVLTPAEGPNEPLNPLEIHARPPAPTAGAWIKVSFLGANDQHHFETQGPSHTPYSYFMGSDPENWHSEVPAWNQVSMVDLYPGLSLELTAPRGELRLHARASSQEALEALQLQVEGVQAAVVSEGQDELLLQTPAGSVRFPLVETTALSEALPDVIPSAGSFTVGAPYTSQGALSESAAASVKKWYEYSTFLGSSGYDFGMRIAANQWGSAYVAGFTYSLNFPTTPGTFDPTFNGAYDAFVVRIDPAGERLLYATFLGGSSFDGVGSLIIDDQGTAYLGGITESDDFPLTSNAYNAGRRGLNDCFAAALAPSGKSLVFSLLYGGSSSEYPSGLARDSQGHIYVSGATYSADFPVTSGALDDILEGYEEGYLTVFQPDGSEIIYSTLLGGEGRTNITSIYAPALNQVYIAGFTESKTFPHTPYAFDRKMKLFEGFAARLDLTRPKLVYATLLGGKGDDAATAVYADKAGYVYLTGYTNSRDFPTTPDAYANRIKGWTDIFVTKLTPDGRRVEYSTLIGGSSRDMPVGMAVDRSGAVYLTGETESADFPAASGAFGSTASGGIRVFVIKLARDASRLIYSSFLGGSNYELSGGLSLSASGAVFVTGKTFSPDFPTTPGVLDPLFNTTDGKTFVARLWVQNQPPKDPALMTADELYLEEDQASEPILYRLFLPLFP